MEAHATLHGILVCGLPLIKTSFLCSILRIAEALYFDPELGRFEQRPYVLVGHACVVALIVSWSHQEDIANDDVPVPKQRIMHPQE
jgi:hypothetical protein